jgi:hypothetical protein
MPDRLNISPMWESEMLKPWRRALLAVNELAAHFIVAMIVLGSIKLTQTWIGKLWSPPSGNPHAHPKMLEGAGSF